MGRIQELEKMKAEAFEALDMHQGQGILAIATGCGKSKLAMEYIISKNAKKVLWIVPTEKLRDVGVPDEFEKWGHEDYLKDSVKIICYASIKKLQDRVYDYVILDEGHRITNLSSTFFTRNLAKKVICLTATPPHEEEKKELLENFLRLEVVLEIDINEAVRRNLVAPYTIRTIGVDLDSKTPIKFKFGRGWKMRTEKQHYNEINSKIAYNVNMGMPISAQDAITRKRHIIQCPSKIETAMEFMYEYPSGEDNRTLIFSGSIANAEMISPDTYHSKTTTKSYDAFNSKETHELSVVNSANEGLNFVDIDRAIITQIDANKRHLIQRIGRTVRYRDGHNAEIIIFYYKNTQDEVWVDSNLGNL